MYRFVLADIRVRIHIANNILSKIFRLEEEEDEKFELENLYYQCAVCCKVGFGVARDSNKSQEFMRRCSEYDHINFARELELVETGPYHWYQGSDSRTRTNYRKMFLARINFRAPEHGLLLTYLKQGNIDNIEVQYWNEIIDIQRSLGM